MRSATKGSKSGAPNMKKLRLKLQLKKKSEDAMNDKVEEEDVDDEEPIQPRKQQQYFNRASPMKIIRVCKNFDKKQRKKIIKAGFGSFLEIKCSKIDHEACKYLMDHFDPDFVALEFPERGNIPITVEAVQLVLGIPKGPFPVIYQYDSESVKYVLQLLDVGDGRQPKIKDVEDRLSKMAAADDSYLLLWMIYVICFLAPTTGVRVGPKCYPSLVATSEISKLNWCRFVINVLVKATKARNRKNIFKACMPLLLIKYVDSLVTKGIHVQDDGPRICVWTNQMVKAALAHDRNDDGTFGKLPLKPIIRSGSNVTASASAFSDFYFVDPGKLDLFLAAHTPPNCNSQERSRFRVAAHQMIKDFEKSLGKVMDTFSYKGENVDDVSDSKPESSHARHTKGNKKGASRKGKCIASAQDLDSSEDTFDEDFVVDLDDSDQSGSDSGTDLADEDDGADLDDEDDFVERGPEPKKRRYAKEIKKVPNVMNRASDLNKARKVSVKESKEQKNVEASKLSVKETKRQKIVEARKVSDKDRKKQKTVEAKQTPTVKPLDLKKASKVSLRESKKRKIVECQQTVVDLELEVDEQEESKRKQAANKEATNVKRTQNSANLRERDAGSSKVCFDQSVNVVVKDRGMFSGPNENLLRKHRGKSASVALPVMIDRLKKDFVPQGEVSPTQLATNESLPLACDQGLEVTSKVGGNAPTLVVCTLANLSIYDTDSACSGDLKNAEALRTGDVSNSVAVDVDKSADLEHKEAAQAVLEPALLQTTTCVGKEEANNVDAEKSVVFNPDLVPKEKNQSVLESTIVSVANQQASGATEDPFAQKDAQISLEAPSESKNKAILMLKSSKPLY